MAYRESARSELRRLMRDNERREQAEMRRRGIEEDNIIGYALNGAEINDAVTVHLGHGVAQLRADGPINTGQLVSAGHDGFVHYAGDNANLARAAETVRGNISFGTDEHRATIENVEMHIEEQHLENIREQLLRVAAENRNFFIGGHAPRPRDIFWEEPEEPKPDPDKTVMKWKTEIKMEWD